MVTSRMPAALTSCATTMVPWGVPLVAGQSDTRIKTFRAVGRALRMSSSLATVRPHWTQRKPCDARSGAMMAAVRSDASSSSAWTRVADEVS